MNAWNIDRVCLEEKFFIHSKRKSQKNRCWSFRVCELSDRHLHALRAQLRAMKIYADPCIVIEIYWPVKEEQNETFRLYIVSMSRRHLMIYSVSLLNLNVAIECLEEGKSNRSITLCLKQNLLLFHSKFADCFPLQILLSLSQSHKFWVFLASFTPRESKQQELPRLSFIEINWDVLACDDGA